MLGKKPVLERIKEISIISITLAGCWLSQTPKLLALPQDVIINMLRPIPVFTITNSEGAPLVASGEKNEKVAGVFISKQDATGFVERLKKENPELGKQVKVVPVSLGEIFQLSENSAKKDGIVFAYVPSEKQMQQAKQLNPQYQGGVPLFVATIGKDGGYLTVKQNNMEMIPFFFEKEQAEQLIAEFKKAQPQQAKETKIEVVILEGVIEALKKNNDEMLKKIVFWPSRESIEFLQQTTNSQSQPPRK
ncbi:MAG: hypothetical protein NZ901_02875 [Geminocystis sp.]|nr:hypothetical protein [Geminocystis sp.]HIK37809.1 hypothetical protein [Geminocystis sp. M7585_C2015_104]MCS7147115.1 hypothetical protein [Geminocystis sp.]MCX8079136.1 hypothetical protein [Geminocystis sp.]MDW8116751.1 Tic22 family protein [Geminocystis sp.]